MTSSPFPASYTPGQSFTGKLGCLFNLNNRFLKQYLSFRTLPFGPVDRRSPLFAYPPTPFFRYALRLFRFFLR